MVAPRQCLHQKVAMGMHNLKMESLSRCNKRTGRLGPVETPLHAPSKVMKMDIFEFSKLSKTVVPCLHQGNVYIKRKLWVWRTQKMQSLSRCNKRSGRFGPAETPFHAPSKVTKMDIFEFSKSSKKMVPCLHQGNVYIKR